MSVVIVAVDPGPIKSACIILRDDSVLYAEIVETSELFTSEWAYDHVPECVYDEESKLFIERIASYEMAVGESVFETCYQSGRLAERAEYEFGLETNWMPRKEVKLFVCGTHRAKDANIRQALIDLWGGKEKAIGNKKAPGKLYGLKADLWAALGIAVTARAKFDESARGES